MDFLKDLEETLGVERLPDWDEDDESSRMAKVLNIIKTLKKVSVLENVLFKKNTFNGKKADFFTNLFGKIGKI